MAVHLSHDLRPGLKRSRFINVFFLCLIITVFASPLLQRYGPGRARVFSGDLCLLVGYADEGHPPMGTSLFLRALTSSCPNAPLGYQPPPRSLSRASVGLAAAARPIRDFLFSVHRYGKSPVAPSRRLATLGTLFSFFLSNRGMEAGFRALLLFRAPTFTPRKAIVARIGVMGYPRLLLPSGRAPRIFTPLLLLFFSLSWPFPYCLFSANHTPAFQSFERHPLHHRRVFWADKPLFSPFSFSILPFPGSNEHFEMSCGKFDTLPLPR